MKTAEPRVRELNQGYRSADVHLPREAHQSRDRGAEPAYYDVPMLKRSPWKWEIAGYFFFGGLSGGAYLLARLAERFGGRRTRDVTRFGTAVAALSVLPCAPLLIKDLGDMSRFHHMLRVFKPESPMNLGTWTLTTYSGAAALALLRELLRHDELRPAAKTRLAAAMERNPMLIAAVDGAGIPAALLMTSYTGVLLSCTATPIWTRNAWLAPLFASSAMSTGAAAIELSLACCNSGDKSDRSRRVLKRISAAARVAEGVTLAGYVRSAGEAAKPLISGNSSRHTWVAAGALIAPEVIQHALPGKANRWKLALAAGITLLGGLSLRRGIVDAGNESADDPETARRSSRQQP